MTIRDLRKALGLTQLELAVKLKIDTGTVSCWERGIYKPNVTQQKKIDKLINKHRPNHIERFKDLLNKPEARLARAKELLSKPENEGDEGRP